MGVSLKIINNQGFTLLELMVTVAIAAILVTMAVPTFRDTIRNNRLVTTNNMLLASLNLARSEAIKRNMPVTVRKVDNNSFTNLGAGADWENGWDVFTDVNNNSNFDAGTDVLIKTYQSVPVNFTLRGDAASGFANSITYQANGISGAGSFVLCDNFDFDNVPQIFTSRMIIVGVTGRAMTASDADSDGIPNTNAGAEIISCTSATFT
jgi:type IV fimbrial biogenesis protein FimT